MKVKQTKTLKLPTSVLAIDPSADGQHVYAACMDGGVYEVALENGEHRRLTQHESFASGVVCIDHTLVSAGYDGILRWHDLQTDLHIRSVPAHGFWSWQMRASPDRKLIASATGQYRAGGPKYEPAAEREPSIRVFDARSGDPIHALEHIPPVQALAFSADGQFLAAGNLMGEIRVWEVSSGKLLAKWNTGDFTSWGIIKSHCFLGGVCGLAFTPDGEGILACGMGPMRDPMAGNGKQTWQKFSWRTDPVAKLDEIHDGDHGNGHPESVVFHPSGKFFAVAGRLAQGKWNTGFFDAEKGSLLESVDLKGRLTHAVFSHDGNFLYIGGANGQERPKDGKSPDFGKIHVLEIADA